MKKRAVNVVLCLILFGLSFLTGFGLYGVASAYEKNEEISYEERKDDAHSEHIEAQVSADEGQVLEPEIGDVTEEVIMERK